MLTTNVGHGQWVQHRQRRQCRAPRGTDCAADKIAASSLIVVTEHAGNYERSTCRPDSDTAGEQNRRMAANPRAGQPATTRRPHRPRTSGDRVLQRAADPENVDQRWCSARRTTGDPAWTPRSTGPHPGRHAGHRRSTGPRRGTTGPLFIGRDTYGLSEPGVGIRASVLAANDRCGDDRSADRYTPHLP